MRRYPIPPPSIARDYGSDTPQPKTGLLKRVLLAAFFIVLVFIAPTIIWK